MRRLPNLAPYVLLVAAACQSTSQLGARNRAATHRGFVSFGFEASSYRDCGRAELLAVDRDDPSLRDAVDMYETCDAVPCSEAGVYVELDARVSPAGQYGHLGMYKHKLEPQKVHFAARSPPDGCE